MDPLKKYTGSDRMIRRILQQVNNNNAYLITKTLFKDKIHSENSKDLFSLTARFVTPKLSRHNKAVPSPERKDLA